tara:strand:+ start:243 stop:488 length:246 start_codon:yes stop_codon:yes gene_type:complete
MESQPGPAQDIIDAQSQTEAASVADAAPTLSLADLQNLVLVVGVACKRGAVQPNEMKTVGEVYERVDAYVKYAIAQQQVQK